MRYYNLQPRIRLQQECASLHWSDKDCLWTASFVDLVHGSKYERKARYVVSALGALNVPKGSDELPMLRYFKGTIFHTAEWREVDFQNKRVMVVGNGCSANQVVPWIMKEQSPKSLVHIVRSEQWVAPKGDFKHGKAFRWFAITVQYHKLKDAKLFQGSSATCRWPCGYIASGQQSSSTGSSIHFALTVPVRRVEKQTLLPFAIS